MNRFDGQDERSLPRGTDHHTELVVSHGSAKQAEPADPLDLVGTMVPGGDLDELTRCFIEEYAAMGYDGERILTLFRSPEYLAVHPIYRQKGHAAVRRLIDEVLAECGVFRVTETISLHSDARAKLLQISLPSNAEEDEQP